jgi:putative membrane protein
MSRLKRLKQACTLPFILIVGCSTPHDSLQKAKTESNEITPTKSQKDAEFLISMADARMMDFAEGKLASQRATTPALRAYGRLMKKDQTVLLHKMNGLAQREGIILPTQIGEVKAAALKDLKKLTGNEFDQRFTSMITIDHERDVGEFKRASEELSYVSEETKTFAKAALPMIETHLEKIKALTR